jgi:hypothetical protein
MFASTPAYLHGTSAAAGGPYEQSARPHEEALTTSALPQTDSCCAADQSAMNTTEAPIVEGTVAALDRDSGQFVVDTGEGLVSLVTWPDELIPIDIGDQVRVSLLANEG